MSKVVKLCGYTMAETEHMANKETLKTNTNVSAETNLNTENAN